MQVAGEVADAIRRYNIDQTFVDEGAMGAGVIDRLRQLGYSVIGVNFGASADLWVEGAPTCADKRAEMWATMREAVISGLALPDDELLAFELLAPCYDYDAKNRIRLEAKKDMKKRGVRSPDVADALALTYAYPVVARALQRREEERLDDRYCPVWGSTDSG
jgi:phage terminase large subunit